MRCIKINEKFNLFDFLLSFSNKENFYLLDGGEGFYEVAPYSYIGIEPVFTVYQCGKNTFVTKNAKNTMINRNIFDVMRDILNEKKREKGDFPFSGGFIGYFTYDFGWSLDKFIPKKMPNKVLNLNLAKFNWYDDIFVIDNRTKELFFVSSAGNSPDRYIKDIKRFSACKDENLTPKLCTSLSKRRYVSIIDRTKQYIASGDIYQANITQRFSCNFTQSPADFYIKLRQISPAPFGAFLKEKKATVICNSPERFVYKRGSYVETRPIKGTRKRSADKEKDANLIKELIASEKDRAEHIMIVDLERNDLGRICETGIVTVSDLMRVESYANVHHIVSIVSGNLNPGKDIFDCVKHMFPGGSITGAPKLRAMEIIDELEPVKRGIYCGSIGYIDASGDADLNIAIRTGVITRNRLFFNVGGGIVSDSDPYEEYDETIIKARSFLAAIGLSEVVDT